MINMFYIDSIFKDSKDDDHHYYIAKDIAEHIDFAIWKINNLEGCFDILHSDVWFKNSHECRISTVFLNYDNDKKYSWDFTLDYDLVYKNSVAKVIYWLTNKWLQVLDEDHNHCVSFSFGEV